MAYRAYSQSPFNSELFVSLALIFEGVLRLPTLLLLVLLYFALLSQRVARRSLSDWYARQRVYGLVDSLDLGGVSSILVGSAFFRGILCFDKRRLTIGAELMAGFAVLLGVGPLNGIYSTLAPLVLKVLRLLARESGAFMIVLI
jgi:hypothetical protein